MAAIGRMRAGLPALAAAVAGACSATPSTVPAGAFSAVEGAYAGSALTGALPPDEEAAISPDPDAALALHFRIVHVDRMPQEAMEPLTGSLQLVAGFQADEPLLPGTYLA